MVHGLYASLLDITVTSTKAAEPINMSFRIRTREGARNPEGGGGGPPLEGYTWACPDSSAVDVLNVIRKRTAAMRPPVTSILAPCCGQACLLNAYYWYSLGGPGMDFR